MAPISCKGKRMRGETSLLILLPGLLGMLTLPCSAHAQSPSTAAAAYVDSHLMGKPPGLTQLMYVSPDFSSSKGLVRNPDLWCADLDLTCFSPWNSTEHNLQGGTLITRRHVLLAHHFSNPITGTPPMVPGTTTLAFVARDNTVFTRKIIRLTQVDASDLLIGTLDSDLPAKVSPVQILSAQMVQAIVPGTPVIYGGQDKCASIGEYVGSSGAMFTIRSATSGPRSQWTTVGPARIGDSGSPIFLPVKGRAVLICHFFFANGGPITGNYLASINAITGPGYPVVQAFSGD